MASNVIDKEVKPWEISVNRLNKIWRATFPSIIATFWLVTNSKEKVFIDKDIREILRQPADKQIERVFGRSLKDLINLHPLTYEESSYPIDCDDSSHPGSNGESGQNKKKGGREGKDSKVTRVIRDINDFLVNLSKYRSVVNNLYKGVDVKLTAARKKLGNEEDEGKDADPVYYSDMSDLKFKVDSLCNSLDRISVRLVCMSGLVLTKAQDEQLKEEIKKIDGCVKYLLKKFDTITELMGKGKVLYDDDRRRKDLEAMREFLKDKKKSGFLSQKKKLNEIRKIVRDTAFQKKITSALNGKCNAGLALNDNYELLIDERLCYDLIYTDRGVIFPWPPKPESSLMIFDLYVTREAGSSFAISIPGFNLSASSNTMVPVRRSVDDTHAFDQFDQKCNQIEEVLSEYQKKYDFAGHLIYKWLMIGTTFSRLQMALPRVVASIWGDQNLYNKYASITNSKYVPEGRQIIEIEKEVSKYLDEKKGHASGVTVSKEWLNERGAKVKKLKNKYLAKVYKVKGTLDDLDIDFAIWIGLLKEGVSPEILNKEVAKKVNKKLVHVARKGEDGLSMIDKFVVKYGDYWAKIVSSLDRARTKMRRIDFYFDIWDVPEVIVLVDRIHNDLRYVTDTIDEFRIDKLSKPRRNRSLLDEDVVYGDEFLDEIDEEIIELIESFFDKAVDVTTRRLGTIASALQKFVDPDVYEKIADLDKHVDKNKYGKQFSKFVRDQSELSLPRQFFIHVEPQKMQQGFDDSTEVFLNTEGLRMPFPLRPSLDEIYQAWAANDAGIPTFTSTGQTGT
ncbi:MAG: hypothetical protein AB8G77_17705 [Rhodothermales bacterium]